MSGSFAIRGQASPSLRIHIRHGTVVACACSRTLGENNNRSHANFQTLTPALSQGERESSGTNR